ncbi:hypothetical protein lotta81_gp005 [Flavobacterium phage vB_FspM_lotta8-1]|uniref:Uncharacterized protein n=3 Tax=Pippivirus TaxID=2843435 RepID=A0A6B9LAT2_9CAUD|nr:hypothetical protein HWC85_gp05 [Flavobacterium phage vB_FspM_lotta8-1]YP_009854536.1 hypothetical protein HWC86_gp05 [Flavobacterium phage vB_FspM_pippi8-1]QHB38463.1 hypothetical protein lotta81_gp005 [Flavobacterium phage vB_FspM_lotta8-1]QHB38516.1 hypothetical protein lotta82_gp005 [Flavobacterium phage vB_FspM_lotta8-2]QHB38569.1 hypothetical protein pippi81_gp005 [Flavobacterium phage vB_FspM_pippi8-1]
MNWKTQITTVNKNFVIRYKFDGDKATSLIGAGKYVNLLEKAKDADKMATDHFQKAMNSNLPKTKIRLRGGLTITFCQK